MFYLKLISLLIPSFTIWLTKDIFFYIYLAKADFFCIHFFFFFYKNSLVGRLRKSIHNHIWNDLLKGPKVSMFG